MNRAQLQQLARDRIIDAKVLLALRRWSAAYYLAGYAVECALKACIAKLMKSEEFPDKNFAEKCWTHELERLVVLAGLERIEPLHPQDQGGSQIAVGRRHASEARSFPMDQVTLVEEQIKDGLRLVEQLAQNGFPVTVAFWLKASEDSRWYFYIVSPVVDDEGLTRAYRRVHEVIRQMPPPFWIDPFEVKLVAPTNPIAEDVLAVYRRYPDRFPVRYGGTKLGDVSVEGAYLYPMPVVTGP